MHLRKQFLAAFAIFFLSIAANAQIIDSSTLHAQQALPVYSITSQQVHRSFPVSRFILPALAIGYGFTTMGVHKLHFVNEEVKEEVWTEEPHGKTKLDNYLQWSPAIFVYGLNAAGIHGKNNLRDRSIIFLLSQLFMNITVTSLKHITHELRPDGSDYLSFPSGHTANAFLGAAFMWEEYKQESPWLAASGYIMAATTGYLRMYNNKHWFSDIAAGAGIGVASAKLAYWLYPAIQHRIFHDKLPGTVILPTYRRGVFGLAFSKSF